MERKDTRFLYTIIEPNISSPKAAEGFQWAIKHPLEKGRWRIFTLRRGWRFTRTRLALEHSRVAHSAKITSGRCENSQELCQVTTLANNLIETIKRNLNPSILFVSSALNVERIHRWTLNHHLEIENTNSCPPITRCECVAILLLLNIRQVDLGSKKNHPNSGIIPLLVCSWC